MTCMRISLRDWENERVMGRENLRMRYLSALAIIFVVLGHISGTHEGIFTVSGLFLFYSFHVPLFLFISGYFYQEKAEDKMGWFILKKAKTLLLPFFALSLVFLLFQTLLHMKGFTFGNTFSFYNWLVWPWVKIQTPDFSVAGWYLIAFFLSIVVYACIHKLCRLLIKNAFIRELLLLIFYLGLGMAAVLVNNRLAVSETAVVYLRSVVMLFFLQLGFFYRSYLEQRDKMPNIPYLAIILCLRFALSIAFRYSRIPDWYGLYGLHDLTAAGIPFYVSAILGIAFWLRVASILAGSFKPIGPLLMIGRETKYIMLLHVFGFFVLNTALFIINKRFPLEGFDPAPYFSELYYTATEKTPVILLYLVVGIGFSLLCVMAAKQIRKLFSKEKGKEGVKL